MMRLACYKGTRPGWAGLFNRAVRWWLTSPYSHTELVFSDGMSFSCSWLDKGARLKRIEFKPEHWDMLDVPARYDEQQARDAAEAMAASGMRYSLVLLASFAWQPLLRLVGSNREVCSTAVLLALGVKGHRRYDPLEAVLLLDDPANPAIGGL